MRDTKPPDTKPLSDNQADDRLKAALEVLGEAPGITVAGDTALKAARKALALLSLGLVAASAKRELSELREMPRTVSRG
jgi:hypothetical protein